MYASWFGLAGLDGCIPVGLLGFGLAGLVWFGWFGLVGLVWMYFWLVWLVCFGWIGCVVWLEQTITQMCLPPPQITNYTF